MLFNEMLHPLRSLGFRGLFVVIAITFLLSFSLISIPQALERWQAMQHVQARLDAIHAVQPALLLVERLRAYRVGLFFRGAGDMSVSPEPPAVPNHGSGDLLLREGLQPLLSLSAEETAGRKRMQHFQNFNQQLQAMQQAMADHVGDCSGNAAGLAKFWLEDIPALQESLGQMHVLAGVVVREGMLAERVRPGLSAAIAVAAHHQAKLRSGLSRLVLPKADRERFELALSNMEGQLELAQTIAYGLLISNATYTQHEVDSVTEKYNELARDFVGQSGALLVRELQWQLADARHVMLRSLLIILAGFTLSTAGLLLAYQRLSRNVALLACGARELATGNLSVNIHLEGNDELQIIAQSLRAVRDGLRSLVSEIINSAHAMTTGSLSFAHAATASAERARQQERDTQRLVQAFEETARQVEEIVEAARETDDVAKKSDGLAVSGMASVSLARQVLEEMNADIDVATGSLDRLEAETSSVSSVVAVIAEVAEQTNLLALNAAIEAARAGESGRGFAVVADEVRKLAERTAQSTRQIRDTMACMQRIAGETVAAVRTAAGHVHSSNVQADEAAQAMSRVRDQSRLVESSSHRISEALVLHREENVRIEQLVCGIADLSVENGLALASAAESARLLEGLSADLRQAIGKFRLGPENSSAVQRSTGEIDLF